MEITHKIESATLFFNILKNKEGAIWVEDNSIHLEIVEKNQTQSITDFIVNNKSSLISILDQNKIFSEIDFLQTSIFKDSTVTEYPLSHTQKRLWFIERYEEGSNIFHLQQVFELDQNTAIEGIKYALQQIVNRHEVLRTTIEYGADFEDGKQIVHNDPLNIEKIELRSERECNRHIEEDFNRVFDLKNEYPIRIKLINIQFNEITFEPKKSKTILLINIHHIARDGWSMEIFQREMDIYYEMFVNNNTAFQLPPLEIQYKDYSLWQKAYLTDEIIDRQLKYWKEKLIDFQTLELPTDYPRPTKIDYKGASQAFTIDAEISKKIRKLTQENGLTLQGVMLSTVSILLGKYSGQEDIVTGGLIANRHHRQTEKLIGFFANTQVQRTRLNPTQNFIELIKQVHQDQIEAQLNQDIPIEILIDQLGIERDTSRNNIFQVRFEVQNYGNVKNTDETSNYLKHYQIEDSSEITDFDLTILINDDEEKLSGKISYATSLFNEKTIERLIEGYKYLIQKLVENPEKPYSEISILNAHENEKIIYQWNQTDHDFPTDKMIHELVEEQANKTPENIALVFEEQTLNYKELNEKSNQLAHYIREHYQQKTNRILEPDTIIVLCLDRSIELVIAMLAVLKAGAAYLPISPDYPKERIEYIINDTKAEMILSQTCLFGNNQTKLPQDKVVQVDLSKELFTHYSTTSLPQYSKGTNVAYVIYTSGTTGNPKASLIEHHSFVNLNNWYAKEFDLTASDSFIICSEICFDLTQKNYFSTLVKGGKVFIPKAGLFDPEAIASTIIINKIGRINCAPSAFTPIINEIYRQVDFFVFDYIFLGGEPIPGSILQLIKNKMPNGCFVNTYGPSECCDVTTYYKTENRNLPENSVPLGIPVHNFKHYVLDKYKQAVPIGVIGELYIGGEGLSRGYLNSAELTAEKFIHNPFSSLSDKIKGYTRLYKTGDLVRWLPDGNLEYLGRNDDQVKIRGYRIELTEIEQVLSRLKNIKQACVLVKERKTETSASKYLVAYYVLENPNVKITSDDIQNDLVTILPDYMIPTLFQELEFFPLTINGKLDKRSLPDVDLNLMESDYVAPTNELEEKACIIWQEILGINVISVTKDFFKIGGNSILALQISHKMSQRLNCDIKVADIFQHKTIRNIVLNSFERKQIIMSKTDVNQSVLSFAQERLWFIEQIEEGTNAYHLPSVYELDENTNVEGMKYALKEIVSRHEVLRSTINYNDELECSVQTIHNENFTSVEVQLKDTDDYEEIIKQEINKPFNLSDEYPIRAHFYTISSESENTKAKIVMLINIHHIASDGWSFFIFKKELFTYYEAFVNQNHNFKLPPLAIQYKDFSIWQKEYLKDEVLNGQLNYWKEKLKGYQTLEFPTDYRRPEVVDYKGAKYYFTLSEEISQKSRELATRLGVTLHSVLLSSVTILLNKYTGQEDIVIGTPIANRHYWQTENLIGFFINNQVNRVLLNNTQSFEDLVLKVHLNQIEAQSQQDLPFEKLVNELRSEYEISSHPIFQVLFSIENFANQNRTTVEQNSYLKPFFSDDLYEVEKLDFSIYIDDSESELSGMISYATSLFKEETIKRLMGHFEILLNQLITFQDKAYSQFSVLNQNEYNQIICDWNKTDNYDLKESNLVELFKEQVDRTPDNIAVEFEDKKLTYKELSEQSDKLAHYLRLNYNTKPNELVGIMLDRSENMIISILGVMKSNCAYVTIDPEYPTARKEFILQDTAITVLITQTEYIFDLNTFTGDLFAIDVQLESLELSVELPEVTIKPNDLAYVIYTSGTTGNPKGVLVEHRGAANFIQFQVNYLGIKSKDIALQFASFVFDASVAEIFSAIITGATLSIVSTKIKQDGKLLSDYIESRKVNIADIPPSLLSIIPYNEFKSLNTLILGGQSSTIETINKWKKERNIAIAYGPTETSICATMHIFKEGDSNANIGKPINNARVYVLDADLNPVPYGVVGELYIGGAGLTRGYLNQPALTIEKYIPNPFANENDIKRGYTRLYKTGDLVKWLPDGDLEYKGRNDDQVKIRGYRIELGEIENILSQIKGIKQCCVIAKDRKTETATISYLVAYYVLDSNESELSKRQLLDQLSQKIPEYMTPSFLVEMDSFLLTINGKLDKKSLPDPEFNTLSKEEFLQPTTELELKVSEIWQKTLGVERVGISDNFFMIGGNSILAIQISHQMSLLLNFDIKVADIFKLKTIRGLLLNVQIPDFEFENIEKEF